MTFEEATQYLFSSFPSFEKSGKTGINEGLRITHELLHALGNPHLKLRCIHVAGTNGKGSSSHFLASILQEAGYRTGLFTSPHLKSFTERIRVNGVPISEEGVVEFITVNRAIMDELRPSFFEITTCLAFQYFEQQKVDVAIIETGLGGRLDSTNVIENPLACLITNIGWDHMEMLGNNIYSIAKEKAGIIKQGVPVVLSEAKESYVSAIEAKANEQEAALIRAEETWRVKYIGWENGFGIFEGLNKKSLIHFRIESSLSGTYQARNLTGVLQICEVLQTQGFSIDLKQIQRGIKNTVLNTGMKGRWQTISTDPLIICDAVHNVSGWEQVQVQLSLFSLPCAVMVLGFSSDKNPTQFIDSISKGTKVVFSGFQNKRSSDPQELAQYAKQIGIESYFTEDVNQALVLANTLVPQGSFIFVGGSIYLLSELNSI